MGEIRIVKGASGGDTIWPPYMAQKLEEVVRDWVNRVESGSIDRWHADNMDITTEHLRIAKRFLEASVVDQLDQDLAYPYDPELERLIDRP